MIDAPQFRTQINTVYPPFNYQLFEEFFYTKFSQEKPETNREYLPIFWTGLYVNRQYGHGDLSDVQAFLDGLDRNKKYFTIVQYDDCILNDLKDLDILIFNQGGYGKYKDRCYPVPLNCMKAAESGNKFNKDIFCSFIGSIQGRHIIREQMRDVLANDPKYLISESMNYGAFYEAMNRSIFALCPRGYGQTSFRICEALQYGTIPVYLFDDPLIPFSDQINFEEYGILIPKEKVKNINEILCQINLEKLQFLRKNGKEIYSKFYQYEGCFNQILKKLF